MDISKDVKFAASDAATLRKNDDIEGALTILQRLQDERSLNNFEKAYVLVGMADCYRFSNQHDKSFDCFLEAQTLHPENVFAQVGLGNIYLRKNKVAEAKACFQYALWQEPNNKYAREGLIKADNLLDPIKPSTTAAPREIFKQEAAPVTIVSAPLPPMDTMSALRARIEYNPKDIGAHFQLASILVQKKKPDEAAVHLWSVIERDTTHAGALRLLSRIGKPLQKPAAVTPVKAAPAPVAVAAPAPVIMAPVVAAPAAVPQEKNQVVTSEAVLPASGDTTLEELDVNVTINGVSRTICKLQVEIPAGIETSADWEKAVRVTIMTNCPETALYKQEPARTVPARRTLTLKAKPA